MKNDINKVNEPNFIGDILNAYSEVL